MKNFLAVIGGIVVGFFVLMIIVYVSNNANTPGGISLFGNEAPVHSTPRPQTATQIANRITASMEKSSPGEFSSEYDELESLYKVSMWSGYTREDIETLQSGLGLDRWDSSCEQIIGLCDDMQHIFDNNGHPEVTVVLSLVDPEDHDTVFATAARGVIGYDVVKGIDRRTAMPDEQIIRLLSILSPEELFILSEMLLSLEQMRPPLPAPQERVV